MFADDMVLYRPIHSWPMKITADWLPRLHLQFNRNKCKYMILSRKQTCSTPQHAILLNGLPLERVSEYKYLGVYTSPQTCLGHCILTPQCYKAGWNVLQKGFFSIMDANTNKQIYVAYIRPHLEYACQVWDPHLIKDIHALESVNLL